MRRRQLALRFIPAIVAITAVTAGCGWVVTAKDTGPVTTRDYSVTGFTAVDIGGGFTLDVTRADAFSVKVTTREGLFSALRVDKSGSTLHISLNGPIVMTGGTPLEAEITMPDLTGLEISGATRATVAGFQSNNRFTASVTGTSTLDLNAQTGDFSADISGASHVTATVKTGRTNIELSGASVLRLAAETGAFAIESSGASDTAGQLNAASTSLHVTGGSEIQLTGSGGDLRLVESGAGNARLAGFVLKNVDVDLSGGSRADLDTNGVLNVSLSSGSVLRYGGHPTLGGRMDISGGARLEPR